MNVQATSHGLLDRSLDLPLTQIAQGSKAAGRDRWLDVLCLTLLGYALLGRGWAYVGVPPIYVGEVVLVLGLLAMCRGGWHRGVLDSAAAWMLMAFAGWGFCRTWPYLPLYGIEALRDSVIWGYSALAFLVMAYILAKPARLAVLVERYRKFVPVFLVGFPIAWVIFRFGEETLPRWPWADTPILHVKGGDAMVHLAGVMAFGVAGLASLGPRLGLLLAAGVAMVGTYNRGGLLSFIVVFLLCLAMRPKAAALRRFAVVCLCGVAILAATEVEFQMPGKERSISVAQLVTNLVSVAGDTHEGNLDVTKEWRLSWWRDIVSYTVEGKYFWTGKGFGVNLAEDDGFQVMTDNSLRSPHNGHLTILARAGVPGLALWMLAQGLWAMSVLDGYLWSNRRRQQRWAGLFLFLLAYWTAFMGNAAFDVFIEGPMGGIWFWSVYGVGLAAVWLYRRQPELLADSAVQPAKAA